MTSYLWRAKQETKYNRDSGVIWSTLWREIVFSSSFIVIKVLITSNNKNIFRHAMYEMFITPCILFQKEGLYWEDDNCWRKPKTQQGKEADHASRRRKYDI